MIESAEGSFIGLMANAVGGSNAIEVMKFTHTGEILWGVRIGASPYSDNPRTLLITNDGGVAILGTTQN